MIDALGRKVSKLVSENLIAGTYETTWNSGSSVDGIYYAQISVGGKLIQTLKLLKK